jgi:hypothetical protein
MAEPTASYRTRVSGLWNTRHAIAHDETSAGVLAVRRNAAGLVVGARYSPEKGEVLLIRRDPGLLRSQFSLWTEGREWLASSLRWHFVRREIVLHTGSRPLRLLPLPGFRMGWTLQAPRTGEMARFSFQPLGRRPRIEVYRKLEFELVVFSYFLAWQVRWESLWPGPWVDEDPAASAAPRNPVGSSST